MRNYLLIAGLIAILFIGCKKDDASIILSSTLKLTVENMDGNAFLDWSLMKADDFSAYEIQWSESRNSGMWRTVTTIGDYNKTSYMDENPPYLDTVYYRVVLGKNYNTQMYSSAIISNVEMFINKDLYTLSYVPKFTLETSVPGEAIFISQTNYFSKYQIMKIDLRNKKELKIIALQDLFPDFADIKKIGSEELLIIVSYSKILMYKVADLSLAKTININVNDNIEGVAVDEKGRIALLSYYGLYLYDGNYGNFLSKYTDYSLDNIYYNSVKKKFVVLKYSTATEFSINTSNQIVKDGMYSLGGYSEYGIFPSPDGEYVVVKNYSDCYLLNSEYQKVGNFSNYFPHFYSYGNYFQFVFEDNQIFGGSTINSNNLINSITYPSLIGAKSYTTKGNLESILVNSDTLYCISTYDQYNSGYYSTFAALEKIPL